MTVPNRISTAATLCVATNASMDVLTRNPLGFLQLACRWRILFIQSAMKMPIR
jgi:hypothetical protein